LHNISIMCII